jgi:hypothetical protein
MSMNETLKPVINNPKSKICTLSAIPTTKTPRGSNTPEIRTTTFDENEWTTLPAICAPGIDPTVLAKRTNPNCPSLRPNEFLISGIRGIHARPRKPKKKKEA